MNDNTVLPAKEGMAPTLKYSLLAGAVILVLAGAIGSYNLTKADKPDVGTVYGQGQRVAFKAGIVTCDEISQVPAEGTTFSLASPPPKGCFYRSEGGYTDVIEAYSASGIAVVALQASSGTSRSYTRSSSLRVWCQGFRGETGIMTEPQLLPLTPASDCDAELNKQLDEAVAEVQAIEDQEMAATAANLAAQYKAAQQRMAVVWAKFKGKGWQNPELLADQRIWVAEKEGVCAAQGGTTPGEQAIKRNECLLASETARLEYLIKLFDEFQAAVDEAGMDSDDMNLPVPESWDPNAIR
jgi:hypothetical protein